jgi:putative transposase
VLGFAVHSTSCAWKSRQTFSKMAWSLLSDATAQALQQSLKNLERAYTNFFEKRADFPKFKKKVNGRVSVFRKALLLDNQNGRVEVPKMGWMRYRKSQEVLGEAKNLTLRESRGKWYVSVPTEREVSPSWNQ